MIQDVQPRIDLDESWSGRPAYKVLCPICEDDYQHHGDTIVFEREGGEDGPTAVSSFGPLVDGSWLVNPSGRRNAVRILFIGECGHEWALDIVQHKGQTFVFAVSES